MSAIQSFPRFDSGGHICSVLEKPWNSDLRNYSAALFEQVSKANQARVLNHPSQDKQLLDSMAILFTGDETCAAVAISGDKILIATNNGAHIHETLSYEVKFTVINRQGRDLVLQGICRVTPEGGESVPEISDPIRCSIRDDGSLDYESHSPISFVFEKGRHKIPALPDDSVSVIVHLSEGNLISARYLQKVPIGEEFGFYRPVVMAIGALHQRATKVIQSVSILSKAIKNKRAYHPDHQQNPLASKYMRSLAVLHKVYQAQTSHPSMLGFVERAQVWSAVNVHFIPADRRDNYILVAQEYFEHYDCAERAETLFETNPMWVNILRNCLTHELMGEVAYAETLSTSEGRSTLDNFYKVLVEDFQAFKRARKCQTTTPSVREWWESSVPNLTFPPFIEVNVNPFLRTGKRHLLALVYIEEYVRSDAWRGGKFAELIQNDSIWKKSESVEVIDGRDDVHAEMRLLDRHLRNGGPPSDYYGIAMLCCALCNYTLEQFRLEGSRTIPETQGTHGTLYSGWVVMNALVEDEKALSTFLGPNLFSLFSSIKEKSTRLESKKKGPQYRMGDIALCVIPSLAGINSHRRLSRLGIDPNLLIKGSSELHGVV